MTNSSESRRKFISIVKDYDPDEGAWWQIGVDEPSSDGFSYIDGKGYFIWDYGAIEFGGVLSSKNVYNETYMEQPLSKDLPIQRITEAFIDHSHMFQACMKQQMMAGDVTEANFQFGQALRVDPPGLAMAYDQEGNLQERGIHVKMVFEGHPRLLDKILFTKVQHTKMRCVGIYEGKQPHIPSFSWASYSSGSETIVPGLMIQWFENASLAKIEDTDGFIGQRQVIADLCVKAKLTKGKQVEVLGYMYFKNFGASFTRPRWLGPSSQPGPSQ